MPKEGEESPTCGGEEKNHPGRRKELLPTEGLKGKKKERISHSFSYAQEKRESFGPGER